MASKFLCHMTHDCMTCGRNDKRKRILTFVRNYSEHIKKRYFVKFIQVRHGLTSPSHAKNTPADGANAVAKWRGAFSHIIDVWTFSAQV